MRELIRVENGRLIIPVNLTFPMEGKEYDVPCNVEGVCFHKGKCSRRHDCYGAIYMLFNERNGKAYIGQTIQPTKRRVAYTIYSALKKRNGLYNTMISEAIRKYGIENFSVWELSRHFSKEELDQAEIETIKKYGTNKFAGYNSESGGKNGFSMHSRSGRMMSKSRSGKGNGRYGKPVSTETRRKIGIANGGAKTAREYFKLHPACAIAIKIKKQKKVVCIETGEIFDSLKAAAAKIGTTNGSISNVCSGRKLTCKGLHFKYYKEEKR